VPGTEAAYRAAPATMARMTHIRQLADDYVTRMAALDPILATSLGLPEGQRELPDYSPDGYAATNALDRETLAALRAAEVTTEADRIARDVMRERLGVRTDIYDAGERYLGVRTLGSPMGALRGVFDQMPRDTEDQWSNIAARMAAIPAALDRLRITLDEGLAKGRIAATRQVVESIRQVETFAGVRGPKSSFFDGLVDRYAQREHQADSVRADLATGARAANDAYADFARYLRDTYLPRATDREAAGDERYALMSRLYLGDEIDPREVYAWGWEELHRIEAEMASTAERIRPGAATAEAIDLIEHDPARSVEGVNAYRAWLQEVHDRALFDLDGTHFDIDPRIKCIEVMIPPPGGPLAIYYTGPSEDLARPGRTWWPTGTRTRFPKWQDVTTAYHEGVPGHHLQVGSTRVLDLTRYQRVMTFVSGHGEGWALYAERLMAELGYLDNPDYYMGMLSGQAMRAVRVIIDIGMHLELPIPASESFHRGETWDHDLAREFLIDRTGRDPEAMASEILRYLGSPAQAISYKVGERAWLAARESAKQRAGASFDLKQFHTRALALGPMGLRQLRSELDALV